MTSSWGVGQVRMDVPQANALYLPGTPGNYAATPDSAANSITGDIDIRAHLRPSTWNQSAYLAAKAGGAGLMSYGFALLSSGQLYAFRSTDGTNVTDYFSTLSVGFAAYTRRFVRWTRVAATGSSTFYTSRGGSSWTTLGGAVAGAAGAIFDSSAAIELGSAETGTTGFFTGYLFEVEIRNGVGGTIAQNFDATAVTKIGTRNPSTVSAGGPWTVNGSDWDWVLA